MKEAREQVTRYPGKELCSQRTQSPKALQGDLAVTLKEQHASQCGWSKSSKGLVEINWKLDPREDQVR